MVERNVTAVHFFSSAGKVIEAYHKVLQPLCQEEDLPIIAMDMLLFWANNPEKTTAQYICRCRGLKPGIVSVYVERLVSEGYLQRQPVPGDRRKVLLRCTEKAEPLVERGRELQKRFARRLMEGLGDEELRIFYHCLTVLGQNVEDVRKNGIETEE